MTGQVNMAEWSLEMFTAVGTVLPTKEIRLHIKDYCQGVCNLQLPITIGSKVT